MFPYSMNEYACMPRHANAELWAETRQAPERTFECFEKRKSGCAGMAPDEANGASWRF